MCMIILNYFLPNTVIQFSFQVNSLCPHISNILRFLSLYAVTVVVLDTGNLFRKGKLPAVLIVSHAQKMKFPMKQASVCIKDEVLITFLKSRYSSLNTIQEKYRGYIIKILFILIIFIVNNIAPCYSLHLGTLYVYKPYLIQLILIENVKGGLRIISSREFYVHIPMSSIFQSFLAVLISY